MKRNADIGLFPDPSIVALDTQFFNSVPQGAGLEPEDLGGPVLAFDAAAGMIQDMGDMLTLGLFQAGQMNGPRLLRC